MFKFKPSVNDFPDTGPMTIEYYGAGYDPELYSRDANSGHAFLRL
jgi:hypothetical protein|tara:strand:- start:124 stop:258 length:135 start_codon:yes stop_codon:yes gene_type:complete